MGFPLEGVISDEGHTSEFICAICQQLVEVPTVAVVCSHVFCSTCLAEWFKRKESCPKCNASLRQVGSSLPLRQSNPLAYRILLRVKVKCPLSAQGCAWSGDYSELDSHLTNSEEHLGRKTPIPSNITPTSPLQTSVQSGSIPVSTERDQRVDFQHSILSNSIALKEQGDAKFSLKQYANAIPIYTKAISVLEQLRPTTKEAASSSGDDNQESNATTQGDAQVNKVHASCFGNRSACHFMLRQYSKCISDCDKAIQIDPLNVKVYIRKGKALIESGNFENALYTLQQIEKAQSEASHSPSSPTLPTSPSSSSTSLLSNELLKVMTMNDLYSKAKLALESSDWPKARALFAELLKDTSASLVVLGAAKAEIGLGNCDRALKLTLQVIRSNPQDADAFAVRGHATLLTGECTSAVELLKQSLFLDPDHKEAKVLLKLCKVAQATWKECLLLFDTRMFAECLEKCHFLSHHVFNTDTTTNTTKENNFGLVFLPKKTAFSVMIESKKAACLVRLKKYQECLTCVAHILYHADDCKEAWLARCSALHALDRHDEVLADMTQLMQRWGSNDSMIRHAYERADFEVRKAKRPDMYAALGVSSRKASEAGIKSAYRQKALQWHPDKWMDKTKEEQEKAEVKFKELGNYLEILTDVFKRQLYDEGYDAEAIEERVKAAQRAAHENPNQRRHHH